MEKLNALTSQYKAHKHLSSEKYRVEKEKIITDAGVKISNGVRSTIDGWKKNHDKNKEMVALGFGEYSSQPSTTTVEAARKQLQPPANSAHQFITGNSLSPADVLKFDNFTAQAKNKKDQLVSNGQAITGSAMFDINFLGSEGCQLQDLRKIISRGCITKTLCKSLIEPSLHQINELRDYILDKGSLLITTTKESQTMHLDIASQKEFNDKLGGIVHGVAFLTDNCRAPIIYDMKGAPKCPSRQQVVDYLGSKKPFPKGSVLPELLIKNDKDDKGNELDHNILEMWGRIVYIGTEHRPKNICVVPKHSIVVMCGNQAHCGPGHGSNEDDEDDEDATFRALIFFSARPRGDKVTPPYRNSQMSKEKLYCSLLLYHWDSIRICYNKAFEDEDVGKVISLKEDIAWLASHWADAISESAMVGLVDITMPHYIPGNHNWLDELIGEVIDASHKYAADKNKHTRRQLDDAKKYIVNWYISRLVTSNQRYGRKWKSKPLPKGDRV